VSRSSVCFFTVDKSNVVKLVQHVTRCLVTDPGAWVNVPVGVETSFHALSVFTPVYEVETVNLEFVSRDMKLHQNIAFK